MSLCVPSQGIKIFSGRGGEHIVKDLANSLSLQPGQVSLQTFSDGEFRVEIDESVRGYDIFLLQSFHPPVHDHFMELLIMTDALRRASARSITAVVPYLGYGRQDARAPFVRMPITARLLADLMKTAGVDHMVTIDLHSEQIEGFYDFPVDNVYGTQAIIDYLRQLDQYQDFVIVSPDSSGVGQASLVSDNLGCSLAIIDKRKIDGQLQHHIIGEVANKICWIFDDMIDTGEKLMITLDALVEQGADVINACAVHPIFSNDAVAKIIQSDLKSVVVTDTVPLAHEVKKQSLFHVCSIASHLGQFIGDELIQAELYKV